MEIFYCRNYKVFSFYCQVSVHYVNTKVEILFFELKKSNTENKYRFSYVKILVFSAFICLLMYGTLKHKKCKKCIW